MKSFTHLQMEIAGQKLIPNNIFLKKTNIIKKFTTNIFVGIGLHEVPYSLTTGE